MGDGGAAGGSQQGAPPPAGSSPIATPTPSSHVASPQLSHADGPEGGSGLHQVVDKVAAWRQSVRDKVGSVAANFPPLPEVSNPFLGGGGATNPFANGANPFSGNGSARTTEDGDDAAQHAAVSSSSRRGSGEGPADVSDFAAHEAANLTGLPSIMGGGLSGAGGGLDSVLTNLFGGGASDARAPSPPPDDGPIPLDEYLIAKRVLIDLSRSSMLYARPELASEEAVQLLKEERLQDVLVELNAELDTHCETLGLDAAEQLREFTAAITATKQAETTCTTKEELISRLLGVATQSYIRLIDDVSQRRFVAAREALLGLRDGLKEFYMEFCIPY